MIVHDSTQLFMVVQDSTCDTFHNQTELEDPLPSPLRLVSAVFFWLSAFKNFSNKIGNSASLTGCWTKPMATVKAGDVTGQEKDGYAPIAIANMADEKAAVAAALAENDALIKQLEAKKQQLMKAHVRAEQLPKGCVLVWENDLVKSRSEKRYHHALNYGQCPDDTMSMTQCRNCKVYYKSRTRENTFGPRCGDSVQWTIREQTFQCPVCGRS